MKVLIVGDSCTDEFVYGDITRISPEAPVPVFVPTHKEINVGMAKNVATNVESLGMTVHTITNENSIVKTRYVENRSGQMVLRVDEHDYCDRIHPVLLSSIQDNKCHISMSGQVSVDAIVISDYCKGFLEEDDIKWICDNNNNVFVDTKKHLGDWVVNADFIKINSFEYKKNYEYFNNGIGFKDKLIVTLGSDGCMYNGENFPVKEVPIKDVSGAGDTFLAGLVRGILDNNNIKNAIKFAQECTTLVVQKRGVSTINMKEVSNV